MTTEKVIYTDGRDVTVTELVFRVKNTSYRLNGITRHGLFVIRAHRMPGIVLLTLGLLVIIAGLLSFFPFNWGTQTESGFITANTLAVWIGGGLALIGIVLLILIRDRYAVRIATAEGEKNAVISEKKEYITQIVNALNEALNRLGFNQQRYAT